MNTREITVVRIYTTESSHLQNEVIQYLKETAGIRGVSVFRAVSGYGKTGTHTASLIDLSLDLPLIIEFFDEKKKIEAALNHLNSLVNEEHIIFWTAKMNVK